MTAQDMSDKLYGAKCHVCAHMTGPTHDVEPIAWLWVKCKRCEFCQHRALIQALRDYGDDIFSPAIRQATADFLAGRPNPIIDQLRAEIQAIEPQS